MPWARAKSVAAFQRCSGIRWPRERTLRQWFSRSTKAEMELVGVAVVRVFVDVVCIGHRQHYMSAYT